MISEAVMEVQERKSVVRLYVGSTFFGSVEAVTSCENLKKFFLLNSHIYLRWRLGVEEANQCYFKDISSLSSHQETTCHGWYYNVCQLKEFQCPSRLNNLVAGLNGTVAIVKIGEEKLLLMTDNKITHRLGILPSSCKSTRLHCIHISRESSQSKADELLDEKYSREGTLLDHRLRKKSDLYVGGFLEHPPDSSLLSLDTVSKTFQSQFEDYDNQELETSCARIDHQYIDSKLVKGDNKKQEDSGKFVCSRTMDVEGVSDIEKGHVKVGKSGRHDVGDETLPEKKRHKSENHRENLDTYDNSAGDGRKRHKTTSDVNKFAKEPERIQGVKSEADTHVSIDKKHKSSYKYEHKTKRKDKHEKVSHKERGLSHKNKASDSVTDSTRDENVKPNKDVNKNNLETNWNNETESSKVKEKNKTLKKSAKESILSKLESSVKSIRKSRKESSDKKKSDTSKKHKSISKTSKCDKPMAGHNKHHNVEQVFSSMFFGLSKDLGRIPKKNKAKPEDPKNKAKPEDPSSTSPKDSVLDEKGKSKSEKEINEKDKRSTVHKSEGKDLDSKHKDLKVKDSKQDTDKDSKKDKDRKSLQIKEKYKNKCDEDLVLEMTSEREDDMEILDSVGSGFDRQEMVRDVMSGRDDLDKIFHTKKQMKEGKEETIPGLGDLDELQAYIKREMKVKSIKRKVLVTDSDLKISLPANMDRKAKDKPPLDLQKLVNYALFGNEVLTQMSDVCLHQYECCLSLHNFMSTPWRKSVSKKYVESKMKSLYTVEIFNPDHCQTDGELYKKITISDAKTIPSNNRNCFEDFTNKLMSGDNAKKSSAWNFSNTRQGSYKRNADNLLVIPAPTKVDVLSDDDDDDFHVTCQNTGLDKDKPSDVCRSNEGALTEVNRGQDAKILTTVNRDSDRETLAAVVRSPDEGAFSNSNKGPDTKKLADTSSDIDEEKNKQKMVEEKQQGNRDHNQGNGSNRNKHNKDGKDSVQSVVIETESKKVGGSSVNDNADTGSNTSKGVKDTENNINKEVDIYNTCVVSIEMGDPTDKSPATFSNETRKRRTSSIENTSSTREGSSKGDSQDSRRGRSKEKSPDHMPTDGRSLSKNRRSRSRSRDRSRWSNSTERRKESSSRDRLKRSPSKERKRRSQSRDSKSETPTESDVATRLLKVALSAVSEQDKMLNKSNKRRERQYHPYKKDTRPSKRHIPHWSFDLAYSDMNELLQNLTESTFKNTNCRPASYAGNRNKVGRRSYNDKGRFSKFRFRRSEIPRTPPREMYYSSEDEEYMVMPEDIPDLKERAKQADVLETYMGTGEDEKEFSTEMLIYGKETIDDRITVSKTTDLIIPGGPKTSTYSGQDLEDSNDATDELAFDGSGRYVDNFDKESSQSSNTLIEREESYINNLFKSKDFVMKSTSKDKRNRLEDASELHNRKTDEDKCLTFESPKSEDETTSNLKGKENRLKERVLKDMEKRNKPLKSLSDASTKASTEDKDSRDDTIDKDMNRANRQKIILSSDSDVCLDWTDEENALDNKGKEEDVFDDYSDGIAETAQCQSYIVIDTVDGSDSETSEKVDTDKLNAINKTKTVKKVKEHVSEDKCEVEQVQESLECMVDSVCLDVSGTVFTVVDECAITPENSFECVGIENTMADNNGTSSKTTNGETGKDNSDASNRQIKECSVSLTPIPLIEELRSIKNIKNKDHKQQLYEAECKSKKCNTISDSSNEIKSSTVFDSKSNENSTESVASSESSKHSTEFQHTIESDGSEPYLERNKVFIGKDRVLFIDDVLVVHQKVENELNALDYQIKNDLVNQAEILIDSLDFSCSDTDDVPELEDIPGACVNADDKIAAKHNNLKSDLNKKKLDIESEISNDSVDNIQIRRDDSVKEPCCSQDRNDFDISPINSSEPLTKDEQVNHEDLHKDNFSEKQQDLEFIRTDTSCESMIEDDQDKNALNGQEVTKTLETDIKTETSVGLDFSTSKNPYSVMDDVSTPTLSIDSTIETKINFIKKSEIEVNIEENNTCEDNQCLSTNFEADVKHSSSDNSLSIDISPNNDGIIKAHRNFKTCHENKAVRGIDDTESTSSTWLYPLSEPDNESSQRSSFYPSQIDDNAVFHIEDTFDEETCEKVNTSDEIHKSQNTDTSITTETNDYTYQSVMNENYQNPEPSSQELPQHNYPASVYNRGVYNSGMRTPIPRNQHPWHSFNRHPYDMWPSYSMWQPFQGPQSPVFSPYNEPSVSPYAHAGQQSGPRSRMFSSYSAPRVSPYRHAGRQSPLSPYIWNPVPVYAPGSSYANSSVYSPSFMNYMLNGVQQAAPEQTYQNAEHLAPWILSTDNMTPYMQPPNPDTYFVTEYITFKNSDFSSMLRIPVSEIPLPKDSPPKRKINPRKLQDMCKEVVESLQSYDLRPENKLLTSTSRNLEQSISKKSQLFEDNAIDKQVTKKCTEMNEKDYVDHLSLYEDLKSPWKTESGSDNVFTALKKPAPEITKGEKLNKENGPIDRASVKTDSVSHVVEFDCKKKDNEAMSKQKTSNCDANGKNILQRELKFSSYLLLKEKDEVTSAIKGKSVVFRGGRTLKNVKNTKIDAFGSRPDTKKQELQSLKILNKTEIGSKGNTSIKPEHILKAKEVGVSHSRKFGIKSQLRNSVGYLLDNLRNVKCKEIKSETGDKYTSKKICADGEINTYVQCENDQQEINKFPKKAQQSGIISENFCSLEEKCCDSDVLPLDNNCHVMETQCSAKNMEVDNSVCACELGSPELNKCMLSSEVLSILDSLVSKIASNCTEKTAILDKNCVRLKDDEEVLHSLDNTNTESTTSGINLEGDIEILHSLKNLKTKHLTTETQVQDDVEPLESLTNINTENVTTDTSDTRVQDDEELVQSLGDTNTENVTDTRVQADVEVLKSLGNMNMENVTTDRTDARLKDNIEFHSFDNMRTESAVRDTSDITQKEGLYSLDSLNKENASTKTSDIRLQGGDKIQPVHILDEIKTENAKSDTSSVLKDNIEVLLSLNNRSKENAITDSCNKIPDNEPEILCNTDVIDTDFGKISSRRSYIESQMMNSVGYLLDNLKNVKSNEINSGAENKQASKMICANDKQDSVVYCKELDAVISQQDSNTCEVNPSESEGNSSVCDSLVNVENKENATIDTISLRLENAEELLQCLDNINMENAEIDTSGTSLEDDKGLLRSLENINTESEANGTSHIRPKDDVNEHSLNNMNEGSSLTETSGIALNNELEVLHSLDLKTENAMTDAIRKKPDDEPEVLCEDDVIETDFGKISSRGSYIKPLMMKSMGCLLDNLRNVRSNEMNSGAEDEQASKIRCANKEHDSVVHCKELDVDNFQRNSNNCEENPSESKGNLSVCDSLVNVKNKENATVDTISLRLKDDVEVLQSLDIVNTERATMDTSGTSLEDDKVLSNRPDSINKELHILNNMDEESSTRDTNGLKLEKEVEVLHNLDMKTENAITNSKKPEDVPDVLCENDVIYTDFGKISSKSSYIKPQMMSSMGCLLDNLRNVRSNEMNSGGEDEQASKMICANEEQDSVVHCRELDEVISQQDSNTCEENPSESEENSPVNNTFVSEINLKNMTYANIDTISLILKDDEEVMHNLDTINRENATIDTSLQDDRVLLNSLDDINIESEATGTSHIRSKDDAEQLHILNSMNAEGSITDTIGIELNKEIEVLHSLDVKTEIAITDTNSKKPDDEPEILWEDDVIDTDVGKISSRGSYIKSQMMNSVGYLLNNLRNVKGNEINSGAEDEYACMMVCANKEHESIVHYEEIETVVSQDSTICEGNSVVNDRLVTKVCKENVSICKTNSRPDQPEVLCNVDVIDTDFGEIHSRRSYIRSQMLDSVGNLNDLRKIKADAWSPDASNKEELKKIICNKDNYSVAQPQIDQQQINEFSITVCATNTQQNGIVPENGTDLDGDFSTGKCQFVDLPIVDNIPLSGTNYDKKVKTHWSKCNSENFEQVDNCEHGIANPETVICTLSNETICSEVPSAFNFFDTKRIVTHTENTIDTNVSTLEDKVEVLHNIDNMKEEIAITDTSDTRPDFEQEVSSEDDLLDTDFGKIASRGSYIKSQMLNSVGFLLYNLKNVNTEEMIPEPGHKDTEKICPSEGSTPAVHSNQKEMKLFPEKTSAFNATQNYTICDPEVNVLTNNRNVSDSKYVEGSQKISAKLEVAGDSEQKTINSETAKNLMMIKNDTDEICLNTVVQSKKVFGSLGYLLNNLRNIKTDHICSESVNNKKCTSNEKIVSPKEGIESELACFYDSICEDLESFPNAVKPFNNTLDEKENIVIDRPLCSVNVTQRHWKDFQFHRRKEEMEIHNHKLDLNKCVIKVIENQDRKNYNESETELFSKNTFGDESVHLEKDQKEIAEDSTEACATQIPLSVPALYKECEEKFSSDINTSTQLVELNSKLEEIISNSQMTSPGNSNICGKEETYAEENDITISCDHNVVEKKCKQANFENDLAPPQIVDMTEETSDDRYIHERIDDLTDLNARECNRLLEMSSKYVITTDGIDKLAYTSLWVHQTIHQAHNSRITALNEEKIDCLEGLSSGKRTRSASSSASRHSAYSWSSSDSRTSSRSNISFEFGKRNTYKSKCQLLRKRRSLENKDFSSSSREHMDSTCKKSDNQMKKLRKSRRVSNLRQPPFFSSSQDEDNCYEAGKVESFRTSLDGKTSSRSSGIKRLSHYSSTSTEQSTNEQSWSKSSSKDRLSSTSEESNSLFGNYFDSSLNSSSSEMENVSDCSSLQNSSPGNLCRKVLSCCLYGAKRENFCTNSNHDRCLKRGRSRSRNIYRNRHLSPSSVANPSESSESSGSSNTSDNRSGDSNSDDENTSRNAPNSTRFSVALIDLESDLATKEWFKRKLQKRCIKKRSNKSVHWPTVNISEHSSNSSKIDGLYKREDCFRTSKRQENKHLHKPMDNAGDRKSKKIVCLKPGVLGLLLKVGLEMFLQILNEHSTDQWDWCLDLFLEDLLKLDTHQQKVVRAMEKQNNNLNVEADINNIDSYLVRKLRSSDILEIFVLIDQPGEDENIRSLITYCCIDTFLEEHISAM